MFISINVLLLSIIVIWLYILWSRRKFYMLIYKIGGPLGYPLIGMAHKLRKREDVLKAFKEEEQKYGTMFFSWLGPFPFLVVSDPLLIQDVLTSPSCINKGIIYDAIDDGTGPGLFSLKEPEWGIHRKLLNPTFSHKVLQSFISIFNEETNSLLESFEKIPPQEEFNIIPLLQKFTLSTAARTTMGASSLVISAEKNSNLLKHYQCVLENMTEMCFSPWLRYQFIRKILGKDAAYEASKKQIRGFIKKMFQEKISYSKNDTEPNIFLSVAISLLKSGKFTSKNVEDEANVIVFGAFETTANTIAYTIILLAMFPQYQEEAYQEIVSLFPDKDSDVMFSDVQNLVYMDMVINESMRVISPVPIVSRQTSSELKLSNGIVIPKGVQIAINIFLLHRNKDIWGINAETFNPDNFLPSNFSRKHPYSFIPFTKGVRNCIGSKYALLSVKIALVKLLRNYRFSTDFKFEQLEFVEDITIKIKNTPLLKLEIR